MLKVKILGCGASGGVPMIGCNCATCLSDNPKNKRNRASIIIEKAGKSLLIDAGPDLRYQCLQNSIKSVDAVLITHDHADHVSGMDDLKAFNIIRNASLPIYSDASTIKFLHQRFGYAFSEMKTGAATWYKPQFDAIEIDGNDEFTLGDMHIKTFWQGHGYGRSLGVRVGDFAYSTDLNHLDEDALSCLMNLQVWVVDCLRYHKAPTHAHLDMTLEWIARLKPERAILTHMSHEIDYDEIIAKLPFGVVPAYDGMVIELYSR